MAPPRHPQHQPEYVHTYFQPTRVAVFRATQCLHELCRWNRSRQPLPRDQTKISSAKAWLSSRRV